MTYSIWVPIVVGIAIVVASKIWDVYFDTYLNRQKELETSLLSVLRPVIVPCCSIIGCAILLSNSDDEVAQSLNYIKPSKYAENILEKIYE